MKSLLASLLFIMALNAQAFATNITCYAVKTVQAGISNLPTDAELSFTLENHGGSSIIRNIVGHLFVKGPYEDREGFDTENSYMGFFKTEVLAANESYNPRKYKGFAQFKDFDAAHTTGVESGMFGYLAVDVLSNKKEFSAFYVFQAGDHMGGTTILNCQAH